MAPSFLVLADLSKKGAVWGSLHALWDVPHRCQRWRKTRGSGLTNHLLLKGLHEEWRWERKGLHWVARHGGQQGDGRQGKSPGIRRLFTMSKTENKRESWWSSTVSWKAGRAWPRGRKFGPTGTYHFSDYIYVPEAFKTGGGRIKKRILCFPY